MAHPGSNLTGLTMSVGYQLAGKQVVPRHQALGAVISNLKSAKGCKAEFGRLSESGMGIRMITSSSDGRWVFLWRDCDVSLGPCSGGSVDWTRRFCRCHRGLGCNSVG
jgi:hypothetical protein